MAHKPAGRKPGDMPTFISSSLTNELKPLLAAWRDRNEGELDMHIASALMDGYGFSAKQEDSGVAAHLRGGETAKNTLNRGKTLVERASTYPRAVCRLFWAHEELFERKWPEGTKTIDDDW